MEAPLITIFVRHSVDCKYKGDEFNKTCRCRKHLRWSQNGKQFRKKTGSRSWAGAEEKKRELEDQLAGRNPPPKEEGCLLSEAVQIFEENKEAQGLTSRVLKIYSRELKRLREFSERNGLLTVKRALTKDNLVAFRATWKRIYKSSHSRTTVQKNLKHFIRFCYDSGWLERIPKLTPIKIDSPEKRPLSDKEYAKILKAATGKVRTLIELMRGSGLSVRDASTLKRTNLIYDKEGDLYEIVRERTKTSEPLYVPIKKELGEKLLKAADESSEYILWNRLRESSSERRHADYMGEQIAIAFDAAGVFSAGHMKGHRLRDTYAVELLQKGVPLEDVSMLLGHRSITTTGKQYAKWSNAKWSKERQDRLHGLIIATWKAPSEKP
jgi:site-specific recombinase XerD